MEARLSLVKMKDELNQHVLGEGKRFQSRQSTEGVVAAEGARVTPDGAGGLGRGQAGRRRGA
jgi:hypothetical protein